MTRSRPLFRLAFLAALLASPAAAVTDCPTLADPSERLACFDAAYPSRPPSRVIAGAQAPETLAPETEVFAAPAPVPAPAPAPPQPFGQKPATPVPQPAPQPFGQKPATPAPQPFGQKPSLPVSAGDWQTDTDQSDTGFTNTFTWVDAAEQVQCNGETYRPSLFLRCMDNETAVLLVTDCPVTSEGVGGLVSYQVDNGPTRLRTFLERTDQTALGLWDYGTALPFLRDIAAGRMLKMKYTPKGEARQKELTFTIDGAAGAISTIDGACGR
jgi:hypothetical protein